MPIYESQCSKCGERIEWYAATFQSPDPEHCGVRTRRLISSFNSPFMGTFSSRYNDKNLDGAHMEGHWVTRTRSTRNPDGTPEKEWIDSFEAQARYCKEEGLVNPKDIGPMAVTEDGRAASTRGMPGAW